MNIMLRMNPVDENSSKYKKDMYFYKDGTPEEYCQWMKNLDSVITGIKITTGPHCYSMCRQTLQGKALQDFNCRATTHGNETVANLALTLEDLKEESFANSDSVLLPLHARAGPNDHLRILLLTC
jgi:hypothetical protein